MVDQREATSSDGTRIPYFIVHRRDMKLDGNNPTLIYAYGGRALSEQLHRRGKARWLNRIASTLVVAVGCWLALG